MTKKIEDPLPDFLIETLSRPDSLPGSRAGRRFAPELTYGRHFGPPPWDARPAAVLLLVFRSGADWFMPLTVRPRHLRDHGGQISLPGGMQEAGEDSSVTALREIREELGCATTDIVLLGRLTNLYVYNSNFVVTPWVAYCPHRPDCSPNPLEVEEYFDLPLSALTDASNEGRLCVRRGGIEFWAPCINWNQYTIWGATSMILSEFAEIMRACQI
jgi:8-oxo-dGTP pyrophosphatase MutT (NUDIX family)